MNIRKYIYIWVAFTLVGCTLVKSPDASLTPEATETLPAPEVAITRAPSAEKTVKQFLDLWESDQYEEMYGLLTSDSQRELTVEQFTQRLKDVANEMALVTLKYEVFPATVNPNTAQIPYQIVYISSVVGDIQRDLMMDLVFEEGQWRIKWSDSIILPELVGGNYLKMDRDVPPRSTIYDRYKNPLAAQVEAVAIGLYPDYVDLEDPKGLLSLLATLTNYKSYSIMGMIEDAIPGEYLALGEIPIDKDPRRLEILSEYGPVVTAAYSSRLYYDEGIAPHVVGYVSALQEEEVDEYLRQGYRSDARIGRDGLELWGDEFLSGKNGGALYVFNSEGKPIGQLGAAPNEPGQEIHTTLDGEFQSEVQKAMSVFRGAIVVLERDTGRVLAMVSSPGFNPNAYEIDNANWSTLVEKIVNNPNSPHFNRATKGQYPLGSVFKIITMAAALESGLYTQETTYECGYVFEELPNFPRYDWTWEHFQEDEVTRPSGLLNLREGLIRSCNPFFWHMGLDLYNQGLTTAISEMARGFGLGSPTGIEGIEEEDGNIPDPKSQVDAINLAIGQGDMLVTPLQVAKFIAAVGNGGTLYRPLVIDKVEYPNGVTTREFENIEDGKLPVSPENLEIIRQAMVGVVSSKNPVGTAFVPFRGLDFPIAGKTGSTTVPTGDSHAWFAGYTFAEQEDKPDIAVVVIAENAGEGSEVAAPIFRRVVELYFFGRPLKLYSWEANFDVTRSPTPILTDTPTPLPGANP